MSEEKKVWYKRMDFRSIAACFAILVAIVALSIANSAVNTANKAVDNSHAAIQKATVAIAELKAAEAKRANDDAKRAFGTCASSTALRVLLTNIKGIVNSTDGASGSKQIKEFSNLVDTFVKNNPNCENLPPGASVP